jgi:hypothetical protein
MRPPIAEEAPTDRTQHESPLLAFLSLFAVDLTCTPWVCGALPPSWETARRSGDERR